MGCPNARTLSTATVWAGLAAMVSGCGGDTGMSRAPIVPNGSVQTTALNRVSTNGDTEYSVQQAATLVLDSYLWEPWFARVNGDFTTAYDTRFGDDDGSSLVGTGSATLSVLPRSKYPATLNLSHTDSRVSGDFGDADFTRDRAALSARGVYGETIRGGVTASFDRTEREDSGVLNSHDLSFNVSKSFDEESAFFGLRSIGVGAAYRAGTFTAEDPLDDDRDRQTMTLRVDSHSEPFENLYYDTLLTVTSDAIEEGVENFDRFSIQGVSTAQYRPEDKPWIVTGTLRTLLEDITEEDAGIDNETSTQLASATVSMRWPWTDRLSFTAGLRAAYQDIARDEGSPIGGTDLSEGKGFSGTVLGGVDYFSETREVRGFDWRWNANALTENGVLQDEGFVSRDSVSVGHSFERDMPDMIFVPVRLSLDQSGEVRVDTVDDDILSVRVSHSATMNYNRHESGRSTFGRFHVRDSRNVVGETREFQTLQVRAGHRRAIDRDRRIQGNVTAQVLRDVSDDDSDFFMNVSGDLSYDHRNVRGVENLGFRSELRVNVVDIDSLFIDPEDDEFTSDTVRTDWRNILRYRIGRLTTEAEATLFERDTRFGYLVLVRLRRDFGGDN